MGLMERSANESVPTPSGYLACLACGVRTLATAGEVEEFVIAPTTGSSLSLPSEFFVLTLTRCDDCRFLSESANSLLDAMPEVRWWIGARDIAMHRLSAALHALDALGVHESETLQKLTATAKDVRMLINAMAAVGVNVMWLRRFTPVKLASSVSAQSERWGHIGQPAMQQLRDAYGDLMARRVARSVLIAPPHEYAGCMLCGVGAFLGPRDAIDRVWTEQSASLRSLGGAPSPEPAYGVTCPPCTASILAVGAVGQLAMSRAVVRHLGAERLNLGDVQLENLLGWAALGERAKPNTVAWAHLDLSSVRRELRV